MSVLELNGRVFDASTTGTLTLTGEGGAATTDVTQGLAKCWGKFNGSTFGELDSFNVTGFVDNGTGVYAITIANDMANANYISLESSGANHAFNGPANDAGLMNVKTLNSSHAAIDESRVCQGAWGDLA